MIRRVFNAVILAFAGLATLMALIVLVGGVTSYFRESKFHWGDASLVSEQMIDCVKLASLPHGDWPEEPPSHEASVLSVSIRINSGTFGLSWLKAFPCNQSNRLSCPKCGFQAVPDSLFLECESCRKSQGTWEVPGVIHVFNPGPSRFQRFLSIRIPFPIPLLFAALLSGLLWFKVFRRMIIPRWRVRRGQCRKCGYSLQGCVSAHCAECGELIS